MKNKGFRIPFRAVACLTVLSRAAFAADTGAPSGESQATVEAGQKDRLLEGERLAQAVQEAKRSRRILFRPATAKYWLFDAAESDSFGAFFVPRSPSRFVFALSPQPSATLPTSATLSTTASANYSVAPWVPTAGDGTYPDLGGVATFNEQVGTTPGTLPSVATITLDVLPVLSGVTFNSVFQYTLAATGSNTLGLSTTGTNTLSVPVSSFSSLTVLAVGDFITAPISGGGAFGLTKTGPGVVSLSGTNTYTGGTFINGGTLRITNGDATLGSTAAGNDVTLDGGILRVSTTALTTARNFTLNSGGGTLQLIAAATLNSPIGGTGSLTIGSGGAFTSTAVNTFTGSATLLSGGSITLSGAGTLTTPSSLDLTGTLSLSNTTAGTNVNNRIGSAVPITSRGATILLGGNATSGVTTAESSGAITLASGNTLIAVTPRAGGVTTFTPASFIRQNGSTLFVRGLSLGNAAAASVAQINPTTFASSNLVGGGGAAGSTTISVVPWIAGNISSTAVTSSSFVTYTAATGFRPLNLSTEYATTLTGATASTNVLLATTTLPNSASTVNALLLTGTGATALATGGANSIINISSGALMYSPSSSTSTIISANVNFGAPASTGVEGIISSSNSANTLTLSGVLSGSGGLTLNAFGVTTLSSSTASFAITGTANTYTGTTTLNNGLTTFTGTITNDGTASALGAGTSPIVLNAGVIGARLYSNAAGSIINRDVVVTGTAPTTPVGTAGIGTIGGGYGIVLNGNLNLQRPLALEANSTLATGFLITGNISGPGYLTDAFACFTTLTGNNTFSGGINVLTGTYVAGSDTAFGTGTIYSTANAGSIQGTAGLRTLANPFLYGNGTSVVFNFGGATALNLTGAQNLNGATAIGFTNTGGTTFSGVVANGGLIKSGAQTLTLASPTGNTYTGGTSVSAGTLLVTNTSGSGTGSGAVNVSGTGTVLGGTGFIVNTVPAGSTAATTIVNAGAILQGGSGTATGALTLNGNLTLNSGSILQLILAADGSHSTLTRAGGIWTFDSAQKFSLPGAVVGSYSNIITGLAADPGTEAGWTFTNAAYVGTFAYDGAGNIGVTFTVVPEPATVFGGLACAAALGWHLRRRAQRRSAGQA